MVTETRRTCADEGREHTWERRGMTEGGGAIVFRCPACTAWAWASPKTPKYIRQYAEPFASREPKKEPTAVGGVAEREERPREPSHVDTRADRPVRRKGEYSPRFGLDDWDRGVGYRKRGE